MATTSVPNQDPSTHELIHEHILRFCFFFIFSPRTFKLAEVFKLCQLNDLPKSGRYLS